MKKIISMFLSALLIVSLIGCGANEETTENSNYAYPIFDTNQGLCYNNLESTDCPAEGDATQGPQDFAAVAETLNRAF